MHRFTAAEALALVNDSKAITEYFGETAKQTLGRVLPSFEQEGAVPLRGLHSAAVVAALRAARNGQLNVLALEGNPGIGKTTAVRHHLMEPAGDGYLFLYVSPRVVINKDVTEKFARNDGDNATGIMTVTTNATLIRKAAVGFGEMVVREGGTPRRIDSAAVVDGVDGFTFPETTSTWFLTPDQEERLEHLFGGQRFRKESLNEREDLIRESHLPGVLRTLASGTATLLKANSAVNRVVLTAAMQGYRETLRGTTINGLTELFDKTKAASRAGMALAFAVRIPNIVVMIDEVAGDGAGALFVHDIAKWLDEEFLAPFENVPGGSPFKATLIVSDASLGNEAVLDSYLNAGARTPDKVLVSKSAGNRPFRLAATHVQVGSQRPLVLHVMTNSFPASRLEAEYLIRLNKLQPELRDDGTPKTVRERIRSQVGGLLLASARQEILKAVEAGAPQVIYFAQNKEFLRELHKALTTRGKLNVSGGEGIMLDEEDGPVLAKRDVATLDSSVKAATRKRLVQEKTRDRIKVFLMTSSGARGVSLPKATYIIASVPRFNIESSLMEVAQLIYRGRGEYPDSVTGEKRSGDEVPRKLVMLVDDFMAEEELNEDPRSWVRRASDIVTLVLMLRSTIHTRIKGDAGLPGKDMALVPVGYIGSSELLSTMSQALEGFRKEGRVYVREGNPDELVALVSAALRNVENLFSTFQLTSSSTHPDFSTVTSPQDLDDLVYTATQEASPLVSLPTGALVLPENVACVGPFWMEDWSAFDKVEAFVFDKYSAAVELAQNKLKGQLYAIAKETDYSSKIRDPARDLYRILAREQEEAKREFATLKSLASKATWLAVPLDYPTFWRKANPEDGLRVIIREEENWRLALGRALQSTGTILPVIPRYEDSVCRVRGHAGPCAPRADVRRPVFHGLH
jgi:hypothetical protein